MNRQQRTILGDVAVAYYQSRERYQQAALRGDFERADEALAQMQHIESCVSVVETSTAWRRPRPVAASRRSP